MYLYIHVHIHTHFDYTYTHTSGGSVIKNAPANAEDLRDTGSIPG